MLSQLLFGLELIQLFLMPLWHTQTTYQQTITIYNASFPTISGSIHIEPHRIYFQKTFVFKLLPENYKIHLSVFSEIEVCKILY